MRESLRRRGPTAIAVTLAFLAGGGAAVTAQNLITSADIKDGTIKAADLANGAVNSNKIANQSVANADLANNAVGSAKISDGAVATADIANGAVNSNKITNQSVANADLANNAVGSAKISDGAVGTVDLANNAVNSAKVANGSLTSGDILDDTLTLNDISDATEQELSGVRVVTAPGGGWSASGVSEFTPDGVVFGPFTNSAQQFGGVRFEGTDVVGHRVRDIAELTYSAGFNGTSAEPLYLRILTDVNGDGFNFENCCEPTLDDHEFFFYPPNQPGGFGRHRRPADQV